MFLSIYTIATQTLLSPILFGDRFTFKTTVYVQCLQLVVFVGRYIGPIGPAATIKGIHSFVEW